MSLHAVFGSRDGGSGQEVQSVLRAVRRHLAMDVGFVSEFVAGDRVFRFTDGESLPSMMTVGAHAPLEQSFCHYVAKGLMPQLMHDASEDPVAAGMSVTRDLPVGAHLSVPLRHLDGEPFGTLCCFSFTPDRTLTTRDLGVLRLCAEVVGAVLEKERNAARKREATLERIHRVIETGAVEMVFQPIYRTADAQLMAFEALARFEPSLGRTPDAWFSDAAEVGLGESLEFLAVKKALEIAPLIHPSVRLAINLSPAALISPDLARAFAGAPCDRIVIELTEHAAVASYTDLEAALKPLRARGVRLAIDDVGAGHATLLHVLDLAPELIKLDMSLIRGIDTHSGRRALAEALTGYGRRIGCEVVAEGVETAAEYAVLRDIGITRVQGFLAGRPMPLADALRLPLSGPPSLTAALDGG